MRRLLQNISRRWWLAGVNLVAVVVVGGLFVYLGEPAAAKPQRLVAQVTLGQAQNPGAGLDGGTDWLNTSKAITLADLQGRVVLLDFWTLC